MNWTRYADAVGRMTETVGAEAAQQPGPYRDGYVMPASPPATPATTPAPSVVITDKPSTVATATDWVPAAKIKIEKIADEVKEKVAETPPWQIALGVGGGALVLFGIYSMFSNRR